MVSEGSLAMTTAVEQRIKLEKRIAKMIVQNAINLGYTISIHDGEETVLRESNSVKSILSNMHATDVDLVSFFKEGNRIGSVTLVYGNDGYDVIADYSWTLYVGKPGRSPSGESQVREILGPAEDYAERASRESV